MQRNQSQRRHTPISRVLIFIGKAHLWLLDLLIRALLLPMQLRTMTILWRFRRAVHPFSGKERIPETWVERRWMPYQYDWYFEDHRTRMLSIDTFASRWILRLPLRFVIWWESYRVLENPLDLRLGPFLAFAFDARDLGLASLPARQLRKIIRTYRLLVEDRVGGLAYGDVWAERLALAEAALRLLQSQSDAVPLYAPLEYHLGDAAILRHQWRSASQHLERYIESAPDGEFIFVAMQRRAFVLRNLTLKAAADERPELEAQAAQLLQTFRERARAAMADGDTLRTKEILFRLAESFYLEEDYESLAEVAAEAGGAFEKGSRDWAELTLWRGIALFHQDPSRQQEAAEAFDEILEADVVDEAGDRHIPTLAAFWRGSIAQQLGDHKALDVVVDLLKTMPSTNLRKEALHRFQADE